MPRKRQTAEVEKEIALEREQEEREEHELASEDRVGLSTQENGDSRPQSDSKHMYEENARLLPNSSSSSSSQRRFSIDESENDSAPPTTVQIGWTVCGKVSLILFAAINIALLSLIFFHLQLNSPYRVSFDSIEV